MADNNNSGSGLQHIDHDSLIERQGLFQGMHKGMTICSALIIVVFVAFSALNTSLAGIVFGGARSWIENTFSWYYILTLVFLIGVCFALMVSPFGKVRLPGPGPPSAE
ncbi:BCCT family transporter [Litchfieldella rifensis]|uniref:BCCT family transporter n=1 Tax=Litchfieldella rifensis TaxID=762643 RepID=A0ABV7LNA5_9GAMM